MVTSNFVFLIVYLIVLKKTVQVLLDDATFCGQADTWLELWYKVV